MATDHAASRYPVLARYREKIVTAEEAVSIIKPGDHVFIGTACATPLALVHALETRFPPSPALNLMMVRGRRELRLTDPPAPFAYEDR